MSFQILKALPCLSQSTRIHSHSTFHSQKQHPQLVPKPHKIISYNHASNNQKQPSANFTAKMKSNLAIQIGALLTTAAAQPAFAVTGVNNEEDFIWVLTQLAISAFLYFLVAPPIIMNWLRLRWYKRNFFEMYLQFMFVFMFFPGVLLWAPFLNFRKFPRDPNMKYPWSTPEDPSLIKNSYLKYPWATLDDYEVK